jgi:hypothetical protein
MFRTLNLLQFYPVFNEPQHPLEEFLFMDVPKIEEVSTLLKIIPDADYYCAPNYYATIRQFRSVSIGSCTFAQL